MFYYRSAQYPPNSTIIQVQGLAINKQIQKVCTGYFCFEVPNCVKKLNYSLKGKIVTFFGLNHTLGHSEHVEGAGFIRLAMIMYGRIHSTKVLSMQS
jgi:hypothetical protein